KFPVKFVTHAHNGFRLAKCRNEGVLCSQAPYLLFTDGDCLLPPDHVSKHLKARRRGVAIAGNCIRFPPEVSERIHDEAVVSGEFLHWAPLNERWRFWQRALRGLLYGSLRIPMRPRFSGNNIALWRSDFEKINGFDENYVGWGFEDVDLQRRLARAGIRFQTILHRTRVYHLWHTPAPTFARNGLRTTNRDYFLQAQPSREQRCRNGLAQTMLNNLRIRSWAARGQEHATPSS
ncbi:MAG TPA: galactosyltransferase-related protein, partial [Gemmataceae bacterium]|nr:galactosyltransferase-related protein [Gemmataceae bacterium]